MSRHGGTRSKAATEPFVRSNVAHWRHHQFGLYVLSPVEDPDEPIGRAGLRWDRAGENRAVVDLSVVLMSSAWGRGIATEAGLVGAAIARSLQLPVIAGCEDGHGAAMRVMDKIGMVFVEGYQRHGKGWARYALPADAEVPGLTLR